MPYGISSLVAIRYAYSLIQLDQVMAHTSPAAHTTMQHRLDEARLRIKWRRRKGCALLSILTEVAPPEGPIIPNHFGHNRLEDPRVRGVRQATALVEAYGSFLRGLGPAVRMLDLGDLVFAIAYAYASEFHPPPLSPLSPVLHV